MDLLDYWRQSPEGRAQQLYVAFSEIASSCLDYCEGSKALREAAASEGRLNWASTILYYSMVHAARFLVFLPFGDFPTGHSDLANCFAQDRTRAIPTNWLSGFAQQAHTGPRDRTYSASVTFAGLRDFWSVADDFEPVNRSLAWMGHVLAQARNLRNENNYEALLIAHEFRHNHVTPAFRELAETMSEGAYATFETGVKWFKAYLFGTTRVPIQEAQFVGHYVMNRIERPIRSWYGAQVADRLIELLGSLLPPTLPLDQTVIEHMQRDVDFTVFHPKAGLMVQFEQKAREFSGTVRSARTDEVTRRGLGAEELKHLEAQKRKAEKATHDIFNAIRRSDVAAVKALIAEGANLHVTDQEGKTLMMRAQEKGNDQIIEVLRKSVGTAESAH